ncbi:MAG: ISL3 family transposase, partial [Oligoflexia bacterium]|nr:ISL3 family transposase [Oligoflexia bacterium]
MPERQFITPISGVKVHDMWEASLSVILKGSAEIPRGQCCPRCKAARWRIKAHVVRELKHALWGGKLVLLRLKVPKLLCRQCKRYFMIPVPGVLPKKRSTEQFRQEVFHLHHGGLTQKNISITHHIGTATVERWYHDFVAYRVKELEGRLCPLVMGIDEHFFSRKDGYATTFADLKNHKVFDVVLGRSEESLKAYFKRLRGRERVQVVVMDLSETYRSLIQKYFPNAMIVADRFHVVRLLNHHFLKVWGMLDPEGRKNRGLLSLVRRHECNLKPEQVPKLQSYFDRVAGLEPLYRFKQDLMQLLLKKHQRRDEAKDLIPQLLWHMNECLQSPWEPLKTFGQTLRSWLEPIVRMWRFTKNNGITEGLHTKMEMISRRAYGFRNFKNYRLR